MFAYPALIATILFCIWLLVRDHRRRPRLTKYLWIPTFFVMILGSRGISIWMHGLDTSHIEFQNEAPTSIWDALFFALVLGSCFLVANSRRAKWGTVVSRNWPFVVLYAFYALSIFWSGDPSGSAKRLIKDAGLVFVVAAIFTEKDPLQALRAVYFRCAIVLLPMSVVFDKYFPRWSREYSIGGQPMATGVTAQKNSLGETVFILCIFVLWDLMERPQKGGSRLIRKEYWDHIVLLLAGFLLLYQCQSRTALVCLLFGGFLTIRKGWLASRPASRIAFYGTIATPFGLFFFQEFNDAIRPIVQALGRDMTFTGRANIWAQITSQTVNPVFGSGYWNFWGGPGGAAIVEAMRTPIPNAHCGYIDVYLDGGIIGLALLLVFLVTYGQRIIGYREHPRYQLARLAILCSAIIYNLSESSFTRMGLLWFTTIAMIIDFPLKHAIKSRTEKRVESWGSDITAPIPEQAAFRALEHQVWR